MKKILIILFTIFTLQFFISPVTAETKVIPSFEKLVKEGKTGIPAGEIIFACVENESVDASGFACHGETTPVVLKCNVAFFI